MLNYFADRNLIDASVTFKILESDVQRLCESDEDISNSELDDNNPSEEDFEKRNGYWQGVGVQIRKYIDANNVYLDIDASDKILGNDVS